MNRNALVLVLAGLACITSGPVAAQGFNQQTMLDAAAAVPLPGGEAGDPALMELVTNQMRLSLALDPQGTLEGLNPLERALLAEAVEVHTPDRHLQLAWLMAGGHFVRGERAGETFIVNPVAGVALRLTWEGGTFHWLINSAQAFALPGGDWANADGSYLDALLASAAAQASADPALRLRPAQVSERVRPWLDGLVHAAETPVLREQADSVLARIVEGEAARIGAAGAALDVLPQPVRATFAPLTAFNRAEGSTVLFGSAMYPRIVVAADFGNDPARGVTGFHVTMMAED